jgi:nuclear pore complex protein Nup107
MNLSIWVATRPHLTRSFTESKRMAELVDALACSSKAMVVETATKDRHLESGQYPFIWKVQVREEDGDDAVPQ